MPPVASIPSVWPRKNLHVSYEVVVPPGRALLVLRDPVVDDVFDGLLADFNDQTSITQIAELAAT
jgi:hypothetical protein